MGRRIASVARALVLLSGPLLGTGGASAQSATQTCVDVRIGSAASYDCINSALARAARQPRPPPSVPGTLSATSPPNAVGTFDRAATAERMGNAFGHSVVSQRPPPVVYNSPLVGPRP